MTDPANRRQIDDQATHDRRVSDRETRDTHPDFYVSEEARRHNDPTKQVHGAYDDAEASIRDARPHRGDDKTMFELEGDVVSSDAVQTQPEHDGIGPFSTPIIVVVVALAIFIILLVAFT